MSGFDGKVAVVTGAGSGIGRSLAVELSRRGARVSGCDVDAAGLDETAAQCADGMHTAVVDVGSRAAVTAYAGEVARHCGQVHQIYNNAGVATNRSVLESDWEDYERVFRVNLHGVIHGTQAFLPHLVASGDGHVVNISSLNGYFPQPGMSQYCSSKYAVRGFSEVLHLEMARDRLPVKVSVVHPGGVATRIADNSVAHARAAGHAVTEADERRRRLYNEKMLRMQPAEAARIILDGVAAGRLRIRGGRDAVLLDRLVRLMPTRGMRLSLALERRFGG
jgi:NAD(P)-dependent dehydrogenase (short-subunit alcohol dehydrogenase family)